MTRAIFHRGQFNKFMTDCKNKTGMSLPQLAKVINVSRHTLNDWRREKLLPQLEKAQELSRRSSISLPRILEVRPENWATSKAGIIKQKLYGCPLTHKDRVKAGKNSQQRRREYPEYYASLGCNVAKKFTLPIHPNIKLAELIGILLGDGGITSTQFTITLNSIKDKQYSLYVQNLIYELFAYKPTTKKRKDCNAINITSSGVALIKYLVRIGLCIGNKVKQQVGVPQWIIDNPEFARWCVRGLMDTDGGVFLHKYTINNKQYSSLKICFSNLSQPLRHFVYQILKNNGLHPSYANNNHVWVTAKQSVADYMKIIGSSNDRLLKKEMI